ncbi:MAG: hypothetical protein ACK5M7_02255 [Draconibacterium sp.]
MILIFLALSFLLAPETKNGTKNQGNSSAIHIGIDTGHFFSENIDTPTFRTDEYDNQDIEHTERLINSNTESPKSKLQETRSFIVSRTMFHPLIYDLPPPHSHC